MQLASDRDVMVSRFAAAVVLLLAPSARAEVNDPKSPFVRPVVTVSGGVEGFIAPTLRELAGYGAAWSTRISTGGREDVRLELSYAGSSQPLDGMEGKTLLGTSVIGTLRINVAPWVSDTIETFVFLGAGWSRYQVRARRATAVLVESDDLLEMPIGLGVARPFGRFVLEVRAGLHITSGADLLPIERIQSSSRHSEVMHRLGLTAGLGFQI